MSDPRDRRDEKFASPEEEMKYLRERAAERAREMREKGLPVSPEHALEREIDRYRERKPEELLAPEHQLSERAVSEIVLDIAPSKNDRQIEELLGVLQTRGLRNTLTVLDRLNNPHLEQDFYRVLIQYVQGGYPVTGVKKGEALWRAIHMTLYEVALPVEDRGGKDGAVRSLKELLSAMEQFYAGLLVGGKKSFRKEYFSLEVAVSGGSEEAVFYVAIPNDRRDVFEKQILSIFPKARVKEQKNDFNVFNEIGDVAASYATYEKHVAFPVKTYENFDYDPMNVVLAAFSKISKEGEGAAIQIMVSPVGDHYDKWFKKILGKLADGKKLKEALKTPETWSGGVLHKFWEGIMEFIFFEGSSKEKKGMNPEAQMANEQITNRLKHPLVGVEIRLVTSARTKAKADAILTDVEATFSQFQEAQGNKFSFERVTGRRLRRFIHEFIFRIFTFERALPLNIRELASLYHLTIGGGTASRELRQSKAKTAPAPVDMPKEGILIGRNVYSNVTTDIFYTPEDRMRHFYTIGQTGTGKTTFMKNMILQDILNGDGVCMIDPHGVDIIDVLSRIPRERYHDVIYFDPAYTERSMALNMLEYDPRYPEQKTFVVNEMFSIFQKLYGAVPEALGPIFEQYFRNATMLVIEDPETGCTLLDVSRVMADPDFREMKLSRCKNPIVVQFWEEIAERAGGEARLENIVPYVTSKFDIFLANDIMRPIVAQEKSSFNFREIMDSKKILLVNLAKGRLGDINSNLIGLVLVGKILMAALSRVDSIHKGLPPFYLYIDEFQNVTTPSVSTILAEARKYKLSLTIAHQYIKQLDEKIKDAVFGNVGSMAVFRIGPDDAEFLKTQFEPTFSAGDMLHIDNFNAYLKLLAHGRPMPPFTLETIPFEPGDTSNIEMLKEASYQVYGRPRAEVEAEIREKYKSMMSNRGA